MLLLSLEARQETVGLKLNILQAKLVKTKHNVLLGTEAVDL